MNFQPFVALRSPLTKMEPYKWLKTDQEQYYLYVGWFDLSLFVWVRCASGSEICFGMSLCPCSQKKKTCYVREHVSICMIAIRRQDIACPLLLYIGCFQTALLRAKPNHANMNPKVSMRYKRQSNEGCALGSI